MGRHAVIVAGCVVITANSRNGAAIRSEKARDRVKAGIWYNPADVITPEQRKKYSRLGVAAITDIHRQQVKAGTWVNPALSEKARRKLSRPRTIKNKVLHGAIEKLTQGLKMVDLTPQEAEVYRAYRKKQRKKLKARMTPEQRERQRAKWRMDYSRRR